MMVESVAPGAAYTSRVAGLQTGLAATLRFRLVNNDGVPDDPFYGPANTGIFEDPTGSGSYIFRSVAASTAAPTVAGKYTRFWDRGPGTALFADDDLLVTSSAGAAGLPSGNDLCTLADVKLALEIPTADVSRDSLFQTEITNASEQILSEYEREFVAPANPVTRRFEVRNLRVDLTPYDLRSITTATLHPEASSPTVLAASDVALRPQVSRWGVYGAVHLSQLLVLWSDTKLKHGYCLLDINGSWGFASIPVPVKDACVETVKAWVSAAGTTEQNIDYSDDPRALSGSPEKVRAIPKEARLRLAQFRRWAV